MCKSTCRAANLQFDCKLLSDYAVQEQYNEKMVAWAPEHPFLAEKTIRNVVFEAYAVSCCCLSEKKEYRDLAYAQKNRPTYHFLHMMNTLYDNQDIEPRFFNLLMQSCSDFIMLNADIEVNIDSKEWFDKDVPDPFETSMEISIEYLNNGRQDDVTTFTFVGKASLSDGLEIGPYLINTTVVWPGQINLQGCIESIGICRISSKIVNIHVDDIVVRKSSSLQQNEANETGLSIDTKTVSGRASEITVRNNALFSISSREGVLGYPLADRHSTISDEDLDQDVREKYYRLKRILLEFRSHSKGQLAKYHRKIEHKRVLKNEMGERLLEKLLKEGILTRDAKFYFIDQEQLSKKLGINWHQLIQHQRTPLLESFLKSF